MANDDVLALVQELAKRIDALEKRDTETRSNVRTGFWDLPQLFPWVGDAKNIVAYYIDNAEELARVALDLQSKGCGWTKHPPFAGPFETQHPIARKFSD
jgi:hypothetical protein